jgi:hypothetical protein
MVSERYPAVILGAEGELTWQAKPGERLFVAEGNLNNTRYSVQKNPAELEVYKGQPLTEKEVATAFGNQKWAEAVQQRQSSGACLWVAAIAAFAMALCGLLLAGFAYSSGSRMTTHTVTLTRENRVASFPLQIDTAGRPTLIRVDYQGALPVNTSVDVGVEVVTPDGEDLQVLSRSFYYETGYDVDGAWSESQYSGRGRFVPSKTGQYTVNVELEELSTTAPNSITVKVDVMKNHLLYSWFLCYGVIVGLVAIVLLFWAFQNAAKAVDG